MTCKDGAALQEGCLIDYRLKLHGLPIRWRSKIVEWRPGIRFVDTQVTGPYRSWHHTHDFIPSGNGTLMRDCVRYEIPWVPLGARWVHRFVARDLDRIFDYRRARIEEIFGA